MTPWFVRSLLSLALAGATLGTAAQDFPSRPLTMVMPYAAGGPGDTITRVFAEAMQKTLGQQILVENTPAPRAPSAPPRWHAPSPTATRC